MSTIFIVILLLACAFVATSVVLSRMTQKVQSAPDSEYLELEGNWIRYRVTGGGPPVVLVHGWLSSGRIWERLADRLAQRFTVYTLDLSGFGDSDKPVSGYGVRYGSRLLYAFCAHFGLTRSAVVGHDVGGTIAVKLAADHSDVVGRLVLVATPAAEDQVDLPTLLWLATLPVVGPIFYTLGRLIRPLRGLWMRSFVLDPEDLTEEVVEDAGKSTPAAVQKTFAVMRREISRGRLVRQAGIVKVPVLVIAGEGDQVVDPQATEDWARTLSAEVVLLADCGHLPMLERPSEFNAQVLTFLTGDSGYLDLVPEPPEEMEDVAVSETLEESPSPTGAEPDIPVSDVPEPGTTEPGGPPRVVRKQGGRYPPRNRDKDRYDDVSPGPTADQQADPSAAGEERPRDRTGTEGEPTPEASSELFEWPESLKEAQPWDRSHETVRDEGDEDPEGPKNEPRS